MPLNIETQLKLKIEWNIFRTKKKKEEINELIKVGVFTHIIRIVNFLNQG